MSYAKSFCAVLLLSLCAAGVAQSAVTEEKLANGLKVLLEVDRSSHAVSVQVWYRAGSTTDTLTKRGRAALVERMMFRGTEAVPNRAFERRIRATGGYVGSSLYEDGVGFYEIVPSKYLDQVLRMEADRMENLTFEPRHLEQVRAERLEGIVALTRSPMSGVISRIAQEAFGLKGYGLPLSGHPIDVTTLTREDLLSFYRTYYVPSNATLILVGDFDPQETLRLVKHHFEAIPGGSVSAGSGESTVVEKPSRRVIVEKPQVLPIVMLGFVSPPAADADSYVLEVLSHVFLKRAHPLVSRLLIGPSKSASAAAGDYAPRRYPTLFWIHAVAKTGSGHVAVEEDLWSVVDSLRAGGITEEDIQIAKHRILAAYYMEQEDVLKRGMKLGESELVASWQRRDEFESHIRAIKLSDALRVMDTYVSRDNGIAGWLVEKKESEEGAAREAEE